ncbi:tRNA (guanine-N(7)-)-methyltransferase non-catalytic subunit trm82 [Tolypocladium ophioglossoides CBS 100239]|uniref:tRNA (Guanine-N(7)-)-methyltransferase non-catalytic subunit trm82 n=1 Tax=Tolypocladium ophioglossoides (strain CBS 100239) TaxID=1163406 RepID=A0A0L0NLT3_TOLOC|nr:tRNA (guanine-N(7)-)-methyltransferase non-catalytic subunit trm82 [Tolypocladium ophioglossoides CBS 100239]
MSTMKIPYNRVHARGDVLFAARGGKIHSFSLHDGKHISTWQHPDVEKVADVVKATSKAQNEATVAMEVDDAQGADESEPPAKRQRRQDDDDADNAPAGDSETTAADAATQEKDKVHNNGEGKEEGKNKNKNKKGKFESKGHHFARVPDRPVITQVTSTADGRHVLAVSGHDKIIWVFEHDGQGRLTQLSQRTMPKRPSAVTITPDSQIICADKFGDVYSLPLIVIPRSPSSTSRLSTPNPVSTRPSVPAANTLTVHSKRNLEALNHQKKQLELAKQKRGDTAKADGPDFELTLLLGHVSMLTALVIGESEQRRYILTGDRDEHIRVSRYIPQAHVIESFCLAHEEFVGDIVIPASRGEILVSGGGDEELFVWDWKAGKVLSKTSVLSLARDIAPETSKVAVSGLYTLLYPSESGNLTYVVAISEGIKAIFSWQLTAENTLNNPSVMELPANPLHLSASAADNNAPPKLFVAVDPRQTPQAKSLHMFALTLNDGRLTVDTEPLIHDESLEAAEMEASESEIRSLLYTVENLRKQTGGGEGAGLEGAEADAAEIPATEDQE